MHSWKVCGSRAGRILVRSLSRGACGRTPARGSEVTIVRAGAGRVECVVQRDGSGRGIAAAAGMTTARLVRLVSDRAMRRTWFMVTSPGLDRTGSRQAPPAAAPPAAFVSEPEPVTLSEPDNPRLIRRLDHRGYPARGGAGAHRAAPAPPGQGRPAQRVICRPRAITGAMSALAAGSSRST